MLSTFGTQLSSPSCILVLFMIHVKKKKKLHANTRYRASVTSYFLFCNVQLLITIVNHISNPKYKKKQKKFKGEKEKGKQNKKIASRPIPMNS